MTDTIDHAQANEEQDRAMALRLQATRVAASHAPRREGIDERCIECDQPIEPARLAVLAGKTSRCAECARDHEQRMRGYRR